MAERDGERSDWLARHSLSRNGLSLQRAAQRLLDSARRDQAPDDLAERLLVRLGERAASEQASPSAASRPLGSVVELGHEPPGSVDCLAHKAPGSPVVAADVLAVPARGWRRGFGAGAALLALALAAFVVQKNASRAPLPAKAISNGAAASNGAASSNGGGVSRGPASEAPRPARHAPSATPNGPCERAERAQLQRPLIDDFEDGNARIAAYDGRSGYWQLVTAQDPAPPKPRLLVPERVALSSGSTNALHVKLGSLTGWGAAVTARFGPPCYDVSLFRGIRFRAKGPARVTVHVQMPEVVPREFGGVCDSECYLDHQRVFSISPNFESYELSFAELTRGKPPEDDTRGKPRDDLPRGSPRDGRGELSFDPRRVHGLSFTVVAADTPTEYWLDDVALTP